MRMTYRIAYSLGMDAANDQMQQAGRTAWNEEYPDLATRTLTLHFPLCMELPAYARISAYAPVVERRRSVSVLQS